MKIRTEWKRQGRVNWRDDWVEQHGPIRSYIPGEDDHVRFVNFDLKANGYSDIERDPTGQLWIAIPGLEEKMRDLWTSSDPPDSMHPAISALIGVQQILAHHGFALTDELESRGRLGFQWEDGVFPYDATALSRASQLEWIRLILLKTKEVADMLGPLQPRESA